MGDDILQNHCDFDLDFKNFSGKPDELIILLQTVQKEYGYISKESVRQIAYFLKLSETHIFGVASFYSQFRFEKPGDNVIRICQGTACHVQGGAQLAQETQKILGIAPGETTSDRYFDFQQVACLGCCAQASVVEINGKIFGKMSPDHLRKVLQEHEQL